MVPIKAHFYSITYESGKEIEREWKIKHVDGKNMNINFVRKAILAFNYSITSTFDSTPTDRPALKVKVFLPMAWCFASIPM